ncbi:formamidopyrimidine-DNA glycosylase [Paramyrothecium foliicola]|nr:formamidopyrimidine-DNA glycosylase [Paramyrothecium foliicola]
MTKPWKEFRQEIVRLYIQEGRTLRDVQDIMRRQHNFNASIRSYRQQFDHWGVGKYKCKKRSRGVSSVGHPPSPPATPMLPPMAIPIHGQKHMPAAGPPADAASHDKCWPAPGGAAPYAREHRHGRSHSVTLPFYHSSGPVASYAGTSPSERPYQPSRASLPMMSTLADNGAPGWMSTRAQFVQSEASPREPSVLVEMPEIAEVARIVHYLRKTLIGKRIINADAIDDGNVFGKVGTSGVEVTKALKGKKVVSAGSQGKYFWITFDKPPHLVMHFGMSGWVHIRGEKTAYTNYSKKLKDDELEKWPPKYWKFHFETDGQPAAEVAFTDPRRFGRVRLVNCPGDEIRKHSPLVENGPDPVVDKDIFTQAYLQDKMKSRHVPIKALLLDQTMISGVGNWVADETLYQAKLHPEQYCDTFNDAQVKTLYESIRYVCQTAVDKLGDSDQFPEHWLFNYRWGKGGKSASQALPNGEKLAFITVGGRTSCYAPAVQRKTGSVAPKVKTEVIEPDGAKADAAPKVARKGKQKLKAEPDADSIDDTPPSKKAKVEPIKSETKGKSRSISQIPAKEEPQEDNGRRRSTRLRK